MKAQETCILCRRFYSESGYSRLNLPYGTMYCTVQFDIFKGGAVTSRFENVQLLTSQVGVST